MNLQLHRLLLYEVFQILDAVILENFPGKLNNHFHPEANEVTLKSHFYPSLPDLHYCQSNIYKYTISNTDLGEDMSGTRDFGKKQLSQ